MSSQEDHDFDQAVETLVEGLTTEEVVMLTQFGRPLLAAMRQVWQNGWREGRLHGMRNVNIDSVNGSGPSHTREGEA